jgi:hypothetical protein
MLYDKGISRGRVRERRKEVTLLYDVAVRFFPGCTIFPCITLYFYFPYTVLYPPWYENKQEGVTPCYLVGSYNKRTNQPTNQPTNQGVLNLSQIKLSSSLRITFIPIVSVVHYLQLRSFLLSTHPPYIVLVIEVRGLMPPKYETLIVCTRYVPNTYRIEIRRYVPNTLTSWR